MKNKSSNKSLGKAKDSKNDEFYTRFDDIQAELNFYKDQLKDRVIYCNCDDPAESAFIDFFKLNFDYLGIKKLIGTRYQKSNLFLFADPVRQSGYRLEITSKNKNDKKPVKIKLKGDGDFRSHECVELLKEADIVVTNPPFSLFREFIELLIKYNKQFIIVAPDSALHYKDIFKLIKSNKLWLGYGRVKEFIQPDGSIKKMGNIGWVTNLDTTKRHEPLILYKKYSPEEYPQYDNYDAIDVGRTAAIPADYYGKIGVPDAFLDKYNPDQFELIGIPTGDSGKELGVKKNYRGRTDISVTRNGKTSCPYSRIIIKQK